MRDKPERSESIPYKKRATRSPKSPKRLRPNPLPCSSSSHMVILRREVWCSNYDRCLNQAVKHEWQSFTCHRCKAFRRIALTPAQIQEEADRCRALLYSLFMKRISSKHLHRLLEYFESERDQNYTWYLDDVC